MVAIGPAGESLVRLALAITDKTSTLGRNGLGAVLGSKNLKAIVVRGSKGVDVAHKERFLRAAHRIRGEIAKWAHLEEHHTLGIHAYWEVYRQTMHPGLWPRQRWDRLYGKHVAREAIFDNLACTNCMMACRSSFPLFSGPHAGEYTYTGTFLGHLANLGQGLNLTDWR